MRARVPVPRPNTSRKARTPASTGGSASLYSPYIDIVARVAKERNIDPLLIEAMMHVESRAQTKATSPKGARGLMQVMPATARSLGHRGTDADLYDPVVSIELGAAYLRRLHGRFGNDLPLVIAAYNAGEGAVEKYGRKIPPYRETRNYVERVLARYADLRNGVMLK
ncbi:MAG: lytic transglycosylase domain-containing protein [Pseudomonadota bacterium]